MLVACGSTQAAPKEPPPPTCAATADHVRTLLDEPDAHARKIRDIFAARCEQDAWGAEPRRCIVATRSLDEPQRCKAQLTPAQRSVLERELRAADRVARASKLPTPCEQYKQMIEKLMACDKLPQQSRDALAQAFEAMSTGWAKVEDLPDDARANMAEACQRGTEALHQAVGSLCGW